MSFYVQTSDTGSSGGFLYPGHQTASAGHNADPSWTDAGYESV